MYRYIRSSQSTVPKFGKFLYHATKDVDSAKAIVQDGFNTSVVYLTDSLPYAHEYGEYVVRCLSSKIHSLNIVPMENNSVNPKDYGSDVQGVYEPLHYNRGKYSIVVFDVHALNSLCQFKYVTKIARSLSYQYQLLLCKDEDSYRRNSMDDLSFSVSFDTLQNGPSVVYRFPSPLHNETSPVNVGRAYDLKDLFDVAERVFVNTYGHDPYAYSLYTFSFDRSKVASVGERAYNLVEKQERVLWK